MNRVKNIGLCSFSGRTSCHMISWSLDAANFGFRFFQSIWNLTYTLAAALPKCLSNCKAMRFETSRDFTRFRGKTSCLLVNRGPSIRQFHNHIIISQISEVDILWLIIAFSCKQCILHSTSHFLDSGLTYKLAAPPHGFFGTDRSMMTSSNGNIFRVRGTVNSPHEGQWRGAFVFSLICVWTNIWVNTWDVGDLRCHRPHYDVTVMWVWCQAIYQQAPATTNHNQWLLFHHAAVFIGINNLRQWWLIWACLNLWTN